MTHAGGDRVTVHLLQTVDEGGEVEGGVHAVSGDVCRTTAPGKLPVRELSVADVAAWS